MTPIFFLRSAGFWMIPQKAQKKIFNLSNCQTSLCVLTTSNFFPWKPRANNWRAVRKNRGCDCSKCLQKIVVCVGEAKFQKRYPEEEMLLVYEY